MNKSELVEAFAKEFGITIRDAEVCVYTLNILCQIKS